VEIGRHDVGERISNGTAMTIDESQSISVLSASFSKQLEWYEELSRIDQKTLSQFVLSRGDMTPVMASVRQKRSIIERISEEREKIKDSADLYRQNKERMTSSLRKNEFDCLLAKLETAIKKFLDGENQLKRYLEYVMEKGDNVSS
jgi:hypothetical protein